MKIIYALLFYMLSALATTAQGTLVLIIDTSSSLSNTELDIQLSSYSTVLRRIPHLQAVNIEVILFNDEPEHVSSGSAIAAAQILDDYPRTNSNQRGLTCLNQALIYTEILIPDLPQPVIIDITGDGEANCDGRDGAGNPTILHTTLDRLADTGITINTLFFTEQLRLEDNYETPIGFYQSLTRNFGFSMAVTSLNDFEAALYNKIALEVALLSQ